MSYDAWLRFAFLGLHPERNRTLLEHFGTVSSAVAAIERGDVTVNARLLEADECRRRVDRSGAKFGLATDRAWAASFSHVPDPPDWLFERGSLVSEPRVAIVGTRQCTEYGRRLAFECARACAGAGWTVVSGLARGVDGAAHRGALASDGKTVAVLGCGSDIRYPREHTSLHREIVDSGGAVVTEYPPGAAPLAWRFPPRNRIISGLAAAVVVIESAATGGSLSTAARAVVQGRTVFALPGDVDRVASVGCNLLIRDGAVPVLGPEDLVVGLSLIAGAPSGR